MDSLKHLIQSHPLIDNHAHNILSRPSATNYTKYPFEQITSEAHGPALQNAPSTLPLLRAANQLAELYGCAPDWTAVKAARDELVQRDYEGLVRRCLEGTHAVLLDDLLSDEDVEGFEWHDRFTVSETKRIVRIESVAEKVLAGLSKDDGSSLEKLRGEFVRLISEAIADLKVVGFKTVVCYRTGLNVQQPAEDAVVGALSRTLQQDGSYRVEDKALNDWLVLQTLDLLKEAKVSSGVNKPLQLHTGLGDADISLVLANPAYLQPVIAQYPEVDFVLLHSSYPYTREAGYLACVYPNVYLDLGEVFPMVSRDAQESIVRDSLDIVPSTRLLWSTDGHYFPETFWLGNKQFRQALETVLVDYVNRGDYTIEQAKNTAAEILFHNSNKIYNLNQQPQYTSSLPVRSSLSSTDALDAFMRANPDVKYIWMQWVDYTATIRVRVFPILEFAKIVRKQRRIGISLAVFWMLQDDTVTPEGSTTGQFYMEPDLSSLRRNVGIDSKSATVMTYWRSEEGTELEGCPRTTLQNVTNKLKTEHDIDVTCGFEIEVVLMKPVTNANGDEDFVPCVRNHSWSNMTSDTRRMVPLLEEISDSLASIGINLEQFHAESCPGQFEFILPPNSPVAAVDTLLKARQVVVNVAEQHGLRATLYPRPIPKAAGTASHAHVSISPATKEDSFLAGVLEHYPALVSFTLSQEISYDRVKAGIWAGSEWVTFGTQNRETPIRKISPGHWEIKSLDGLANMYFAMAAFIAAGYVGITEQKELTNKDCQYDAATLNDTERAALGITTKLPKTLAQSLSAIESDRTLQDLLGPELVKNYCIVKRAESKKLSAMDEYTRRMWLMEKY
ncbi:Protein fluG [Aspergillus cristatus]|uniref:Glutamine synthetase n=1 Tax=Aspergillus cristatus TaxID=573508 RepID=A0A1E3BDQ1_ASPCR|nr:Protein fluG [Aspergillus cristatus]